ncbi:MAG: YraN family protein [Parcubacteria group bacterium]|nr:YraN family protein [Parcubacteria group bacterium]
MGSPTQNLGSRGEDIAAWYLVKAGFRILARRFQNRFGEIDLIAEEAGQTVFVEVRVRLKSMRGLPEQTINSEKQKKLQKIISAYISLKEIEDFRVDVVTISPGSTPKTLNIRHHRAQCEALDF